MPYVSMPLGRSSPNRICSKIAYALDSSEFHRAHSPSTSAYGATRTCRNVRYPVAMGWWADLEEAVNKLNS